MKICCVTGHRDIPEDKIRYIKGRLQEEIQLAIQDGFTVFISGLADGADLLFAQCVLEQKEQYPKLFLEAAIPYANRTKRGGKEFQNLLLKCNGVKIVSDHYHSDCFMLRNRYMVEQSERIIAVYDGRENGGTVFTMRHAHIMEREVRVVEY